jgi:hypothetical protein
LYSSIFTFDLEELVFRLLDLDLTFGHPTPEIVFVWIRLKILLRGLQFKLPKLYGSQQSSVLLLKFCRDFGVIHG